MTPDRYPTKQERHKFYVDGYKYFQRHRRRNTGKWKNVSICESIAMAAPKLQLSEIHKKSFPELYNYRPKLTKRMILYPYWWDIEDTETRENVFKKIIKETVYDD